MYRLRKFVRRNRGQVIAASLVLLALVAGVAGTTWGLFEATWLGRGGAAAKRDGQERREEGPCAAAEEERKAKETVEAGARLRRDQVFAARRTEGQEGGLGYDVKLADAITAALPSIEEGFPDRPLTEARLADDRDSFYYLGKPEIAREQFEAARSLYAGSSAPTTPNAREHEQPGQQLRRPGPARRGPQAPRGDAGPAEGQARPRPPRHAREHGQPGRQLLRPRPARRALKLHEETLALRRPSSAPTTPTRS